MAAPREEMERATVEEIPPAPAPAVSHLHSVKVFLLCLTYIVVSGLLIRFNKFLMAPHRFPHSLALSSLHMSCSLVLCLLLYACCPSWFPGMAATEGKRTEVAKWFVPIGLLFSVSLFASNQAYLYCGVAFLQFMKEGNVILSFLISCAVGLQVMNRVKLACILWILAGSLMCVTQDLKFVLVGFFIQLCSQVAECARAVMGEFLLSGNSIRLDPLTYTLFGAPACLLALSVGNFFTWTPEIMQDALVWWPYLLPNMLVAFTLNLVVASVIKECSAVGFMLAGLGKDIALVIVSAVAFAEPVTKAQAVSFTMVLGGISFWALMKSSPDHPLVRQVETAMGLPPPAKEDRLSLNKDAKV